MKLEKIVDGPKIDGVILDIETTGLSAKVNHISSIGLLLDYMGQNKFIFLFAEEGEEKEILEEFLEIINSIKPIISFNGQNFDLPFIKKRLEILNISYQSNLTENNFDLYQYLRSYSKITDFKISGLKSLEKENNLERPFEMTGKDQIKLYKTYLKTKDKEILDRLFTYNFYDLYHLNKLLYLKEKIDLLRKVEGFFIESYKVSRGNLIIELTSPEKYKNIEANFSYPLCSFYTNGDGRFLLKINIEEGYFDNENIGYSIDNKFFKLENKSDFTQISENYLPVIFEKNI